MIPTRKKNLEPIDIDAYFKYRCPNPNCGQDKWINFAEARTKNFKIVCYCGLVIKPKLISKIDITYFEEPLTTNQKHKQDTILEPPSEIIDKCISALKSYGFTIEESKELVINAYSKNKSDDWKIILKQAIESIGVNNEYQTNEI